MMDSEKQIEEIKQVVRARCDKHGIAKYCPERIANGIYNAGYRKQSEVVKELVGKLKFLYFARQKEYTNWDGNKVNAVTLEWLLADIECVAKDYCVEVK